MLALVLVSIVPEGTKALTQTDGQRRKEHEDEVKILDYADPARRRSIDVVELDDERSADADGDDKKNQHGGSAVATYVPAKSGWGHRER